MPDAAENPGRMFSIPPDGNAAPQQADQPPQVDVSWIEFFVLRLLPEGPRAAYLVWRLRYNIEHARRNPNAPCPACGARDGEIRWAPAFKWPDNAPAGALLHLCKQCKATWGERPIRNADQWRVTLVAQEEQSLFGELRKSA